MYYIRKLFQTIYAAMLLEAEGPDDCKVSRDFRKQVFYDINRREGGTSLVVQWLTIYLAMWGSMAPHSSTLAWKIPWMEDPSGLQSMGSLGI